MKFLTRGYQAGVAAALGVAVLSLGIFLPQLTIAADEATEGEMQVEAENAAGDEPLTPERIREIADEIIGDDPDVTIDYKKIPADITEAELRSQLTMAKAMSDAFLKGLEGALTESLEANEEEPAPAPEAVVEAAPAAPKEEPAPAAPAEQPKKEAVAEAPQKKPETVAAPEPEPDLAPKTAESPRPDFEPEPVSAHAPPPRKSSSPEMAYAPPRTNRPKAYRTRPLLSARRIEAIFAEEAGDAPQMQPRDFVITLTTTEDELRAMIRAGMIVSARLFGDTSVSDEEFNRASAVVGPAYVARARARFVPTVAMTATGDGLMSAMTGAGDGLMSAMTGMGDGLMSGTTVTVTFTAAPVPTIDRSRPEGLPEYFSSEFGDAAQRLEDTLAQHPDSAAAHYYLGYAFYMMGDLKRSREGFTRAYEIDPSFTPIVFFTRDVKG